MRSATNQIEVRVLFNDSVISAKRMTGRGDSSFTVGPDPDADLFLQLPSSILVCRTEGGFLVNHPDGQRSVPAEGALRFQLGVVTIDVQAIDPQRWGLRSGNALPIRYLGLSALAHLVVVLMMLATPPALLMLSSQGHRGGAMAVVRHHSHPMQPAPVRVPLWKAYGDYLRPATGPGVRPSSEVGFHKRHRGRAGRMGSPSSKKKHGRIALQGPGNRKVAQQLGHEAALASELLGLISANTGRHLSSVFGTNDPVGDAARNALGQLQGTMVGDAYGIGGLGVSGVRRGGGGKCSGYGVGYGACGCMEVRLRFVGSGSMGRFSTGAMTRIKVPGLGSRQAGAPTKTLPYIRLGRDREDDGTRASRAVRAVIRSHLDQIRYCYDQRLIKAPGLQGQVTVRLGILPPGQVNHASVALTTVEDEPLHRCILRAVRRWRFPGTRRAIVASYPFILRVSGGR